MSLPLVEYLCAMGFCETAYFINSAWPNYPTQMSQEFYLSIAESLQKKL